MNLDSYISLLNNSMETTAHAEKLDARAINRAMHGKANNLAAKVSRAILFEAGGLVLALVGAAIALLWYSHPLLRLIAAITLLICIAMAGVYVWKYRQLQQLVKFEGNTVQLLHGLIGAVKQFIRLYIWMIALSILIGFVLGGVYGFMESKEAAAEMPSLLTAWYAVPISLLVMVLVVWGCKWYIFMLYGKPLQALERCAAELENTP